MDSLGMTFAADELTLVLMSLAFVLVWVGAQGFSGCVLKRHAHV